MKRGCVGAPGCFAVAFSPLWRAQQEKALQAQVDYESSVWLSAERWNGFLERMAHVITGNEPVQGVGLRTWVTGVRHLTGFGGDKDAGKADDSTSHLDATPAVADIEDADASQEPAAIAVPHSDASVIADVAMEAALDLPDGMTHDHAASSSPPQPESS